MQISTVRELKKELAKIKGKGQDKPIFGYVVIGDDTYEVVPIILVDDSISDRVDINLEVRE
jgi:hypothetical protein